MLQESGIVVHNQWNVFSDFKPFLLKRLAKEAQQYSLKDRAYVTVNANIWGTEWKFLSHYIAILPPAFDEIVLKSCTLSHYWHFTHDICWYAYEDPLHNQSKDWTTLGTGPSLIEFWGTVVFSCSSTRIIIGCWAPENCRLWYWCLFPDPSVPFGQSSSINPCWLQFKMVIYVPFLQHVANLRTWPQNYFVIL